MEHKTSALAQLFLGVGAFALVAAFGLFIPSQGDHTTDAAGRLVPDQTEQYAALSIAVSSLFFFGFGGVIARLDRVADHAERQTKLLASIAKNTLAKDPAIGTVSIEK